ncbi:Uncharacterised protein [Mycobacterium tuberculosis]|nr:Uncharacterised protein [Mycobacterium tuberculosis]
MSAVSSSTSVSVRFSTVIAAPSALQQVFDL